MSSAETTASEKRARGPLSSVENPIGGGLEGRSPPNEIRSGGVYAARSGCKPLPLSCSARVLRAQEHDVPFAARLPAQPCSERPSQKAGSAGLLRQTEGLPRCEAAPWVRFLSTCRPCRHPAEASGAPSRGYRPRGSRWSAPSRQWTRRSAARNGSPWSGR